MTGFFYINITPDGERTFFGSRAANGRVKNLRNVRSLCQGASAAHLVGYNFLNPGPARAAKQIAREIHARGGWVSLDVGMAPASKSRGKFCKSFPAWISSFSAPTKRRCSPARAIRVARLRHSRKQALAKWS